MDHLFCLLRVNKKDPKVVENEILKQAKTDHEKIKEKEREVVRERHTMATLAAATALTAWIHSLCGGGCGTSRNWFYSWPNH